MPRSVPIKSIPATTPFFPPRGQAGRSLHGLLSAAADRHAGRPFLESASIRLSYREAYARALQLGSALRGHGAQPGDRVAVISENRVEVPLLVFAASACGAAAVVLDPRLQPRNLRRILEEVGPRLVLAGRDTGEFSSPGLRLAIDSLEPSDTALPADTAMQRAGGDDLRPGPHDPALLLYTSGSTGDPLGVMASHGNVLFTARGIQARLRYRPDDRIGLFLPLSFDYGLYQAFLAALSGACLVVETPGDVGPDFLRRLKDRRITVLPAVPTLGSGLLALLERTPETPLALRALTSTGDRLPPAHIQRLLTLRPELEIFPMYGLTECKRVSILLPHEVAGRPGSVGRPLRGVHVRITDSAGQRLPVAHTGEIRVRGKNVCMGYWRRPDETSAVFGAAGDRDARELRTGDYGHLDADGFLYVHGRRDALLKHRGFRVSAQEIELAALNCPGIVDAALVRLDERDEIHLLVVGEGGVTEGDVGKRLAEQLEFFKRPTRIHVVAKLPLTRNGKVDRKALEPLTRSGKAASR